MKKLISSVVATLLLGTASLSAADYYATVDGEKITKSDVAMVLQDPRIQFDQLPENAQKQVLEQIINKKLLAKQAIKDGIEKDKEYQTTLDSIKENLAFQVWQQKELKKINVSDEKLEKFFNDNKEKFMVPETLNARHILVKTEQEAKDLITLLNKEKKEKLEEKFIELAKTKSVGPSGKNGGDLGSFTADKMVPEFANAASALKTESYSKTPVKTQFGYHVIYLKDKKAAKSLSFNEVKGNISRMLLQNEYNKKVKELTDELRKKAKIVIK